MASVQDYIDHINLMRRTGKLDEIRARLTRNRFVFNQAEFTRLIHVSKELKDVFYNKTISVHLHTDKTFGHVSADLPVKTGDTTEIKRDIGFDPAGTLFEGIMARVFSGAGMLSVEARSTSSTQRATAHLQISQEHYNRLAVLTARKMAAPGARYHVLGEGPDSYNCINFMDNHLREAGISVGLKNLFSPEQIRGLNWRPVLPAYMLSYSDDLKLEVFKASLSAEDHAVGREFQLIAQRRHELHMAFVQLSDLQITGAVSALTFASLPPPPPPGVAFPPRDTRVDPLKKKFPPTPPPKPVMLVPPPHLRPHSFVPSVSTTLGFTREADAAKFRLTRLLGMPTIESKLGLRPMSHSSFGVPSVASHLGLITSSQAAMHRLSRAFGIPSATLTSRRK